MTKTTNYSKVQDIKLVISLNTKAPGTANFVPILIHTTMTAVADDGGSRGVVYETPVGTPRAIEYTPTELANLVKGTSNSTGNFLLAELTKAYVDAIGGID